MKQFLQLLLCILFAANLSAQIITPQIKANFGVDADLKANYFNGSNIDRTDEWFSSGLPGAGKYMIDTTGAAAIVSGYTTNPATLNKFIVRNMSYPAFAIVTNDLLMDAVYARDFHGDDSTIFASGSNKNGQSPVVWTSPVSQSIPDKNEILDVFMHVRRAGVNSTDSLWLFGGLSIENTTGNRYFDFEMYQSDITFDRSSRTFSGYGPDAGHTSWKFDAGGNIIQPGDIILTEEFGTSALTLIEARIWVDRNVLTTTPVNFNWGGQFDGASNGAQFGYASIVPKTVGAFYSGLQSAKDTWAGPFKIVLGDNSVTDNYVTKQFMEFSVNLTKLGLDPVTLLGGNTCSKPFQKVVVKTRASTSFTAELKDFVGPFDFLNVPKTKLFTQVPVFCGINSISNLKVTNPLTTSIYNWSTLDGHFSDTSNKTSVFVDSPGTYIVTQQLRSVCPVYSSDTLRITFDASCGILASNLLHFSGKINDNKAHLSWQVAQSDEVNFFDVERSTDGIHFSSAGKVYPDRLRTGVQNLSTADDISNINSNVIYYRLKVYSSNIQYKISQVIKLDLSANSSKALISIAPNPVKDMLSLNIYAPSARNMQVKIFDGVGKLMRTTPSEMVHGNTAVALSNFENWHNGVYIVKVFLDNEVFIKRILLSK